MKSPSRYFLHFPCWCFCRRTATNCTFGQLLSKSRWCRTVKTCFSFNLNHQAKTASIYFSQTVKLNHKQARQIFLLFHPVLSIVWPHIVNRMASYCETPGFIFVNRMASYCQSYGFVLWNTWLRIVTHLASYCETLMHFRSRQWFTMPQAVRGFWWWTAAWSTISCGVYWPEERAFKWSRGIILSKRQCVTLTVSFWVTVSPSCSFCFQERNYSGFSGRFFGKSIMRMQKPSLCRVSDTILTNHATMFANENILLQNHFEIKQRTQFRDRLVSRRRYS